MRNKKGSFNKEKYTFISYYYFLCDTFVHSHIYNKTKLFFYNEG